MEHKLGMKLVCWYREKHSNRAHTGIGSECIMDEALEQMKLW